MQIFHVCFVKHLSSHEIIKDFKHLSKDVKQLSYTKAACGNMSLI